MLEGRRHFEIKLASHFDEILTVTRYDIYGVANFVARKTWDGKTGKVRLNSASFILLSMLKIVTDAPAKQVKVLVICTPNITKRMKGGVKTEWVFP